jgi:hypothetical protein
MNGNKVRIWMEAVVGHMKVPPGQTSKKAEDEPG